MKNTTNCWVEPKAKCKYIKWQECRRVKHWTLILVYCVILIREVPVTNCEPKLVHVPEQEKIHRKKCLLPDKDEQPSYAADIPRTSANIPAPAQLRQTQSQALRQTQQQQQAFRQPKQFNNVPVIPQQHQQQRFIPSNRQQSFSG